MYVCVRESRTAQACVQRFVCASVLSVCGYVVYVLGSLSSENSVCDGGAVTAAEGGREADCLLADKGGFTLGTRED